MEQQRHFQRRAFIETAVKAAGASMLLTIPGVTMAMPSSAMGSSYTVQQVIDLIIKQVPHAPFPQTVDTLKSGSGSQPVTGIVTTMFATIDVIEQAIKLNANFIIAHEPTFYNHLDDTQFVPGNKVVAQKQRLLDTHGISVWRFHDYWHSVVPDGITYGVVKAAGWLSYYQPKSSVLEIPALSLQQLVDHLKSTLAIGHVKIIGDLDQTCKKIALLPGASGGKAQITLVENENPDVLIIGELSEWETAEYIRDARRLGAKTALIILGHSFSEEPGMEYLVEWLSPKVPGIPIHHIASGEPFTWL